MMNLIDTKRNDEMYSFKIIYNKAIDDFAKAFNENKYLK